MSSAPETNAAHQREEEPLLGQAGDVRQPEGAGLELNFILGTGIIAQAGIWILTIDIWVDILKSPYSLFTPHPLLNSAALLLTTQAILLLQPTHTPKQKRDGANVHAVLNSLSTLALIAGLVVIEANKFINKKEHLYSPHAILGLITYILFFLQAIVGITQLYVPQLYGGEANAKAVWKYHRASGYVLIVLTLVVICLATQTGFNKSVLHIQLWVVIVTSVILLVGLLPRVKLQKLGIKKQA